ncbi:MAG TPA: hypothetical protein GXZ47_02675 [Treponema sp.]|nr:hypothetical protein [Treponema sp.]
MRFELPKSYTDTVFLDRQKGQFTAISTPDGSFVLPTTPFSLLGQAESLARVGFSRHVVDVSRMNLKKKEYRLIIEAYRKGKSLPESSRFNWKDGFYDPSSVEERRQMRLRSEEKDKKSGKMEKRSTQKKPGAVHGKPVRQDKTEPRRKKPTGKGKQKTSKYL